MSYINLPVKYLRPNVNMTCVYPPFHHQELWAAVTRATARRRTWREQQLEGGVHLGSCQVGPTSLCCRLSSASSTVLVVDTPFSVIFREERQISQLDFISFFIQLETLSNESTMPNLKKKKEKTHTHTKKQTNKSLNK